MHRIFKATIAVLILASGVSVPASAGLFEEGSHARDRGDHATALRFFGPLANQGDPKAQNNLGFMYLYGERNSAESGRPLR